MLSNLRTDRASGHVSWISAGQSVRVHVPDVDSARIDPASDRVFVLSARTRFPDRLFGFDASGRQLFCVTPPDGTQFSYLTSHPQSPMAVVCTARHQIDGWNDWHYAVDPDTGQLTRLSPAY